MQVKMNMTEKTISKTYANDIVEYLHKNLMLVFVAYLCVLVIYGAWMFQYVVTFDAEGLYINTESITGNGWYLSWIGIGRWAFVFLKKLLQVLTINPFFSIGVFLLMFPLSALLWMYCIDKWGGWKHDKRCIKKAIFLLLYISHPLWSLQFAYRNQIEVLSIIAVLLPLAINMLIDAVNEKNILEGVFSIFLVTFCFAGYQAFVTLYVTALTIYFWLTLINSKKCREFCFRFFKIVLISCLCLFLYYMSAKLVAGIFGVKTSDHTGYFSQQITWLTDSFQNNITNTLAYLKLAFLGDNIVYSCIFAVEFILGVPILIYYIKRFDKSLSKSLCILIYLFLYISPFILSIITSGRAVHRQQFAYILSLAFMGYFEFDFYSDSFKNSKVVKNVLMLVVCFIFALQMQEITRLLYSDYITMKKDYALMEEIYNTALNNGAKEGSAIVFVGGYQQGNVNETMVSYEVIGYSYFAESIAETKKLNEAMIAYGFNVKTPTESQKERALEVCEDLENYPSANSMYIEEDLIVVKLSD